MKLKKIVLSLVFWLFIWVNCSFASELNFWDFLTIYFEWVSQWTQNFWDEWKKIDVKYSNVQKDSLLYRSLQKWIYLDLFPNMEISLPLNKVLEQQNMAQLLQGQIWWKISFIKWEKITTQWTKELIEETLKNLDIYEQIKNDVMEQLGKSYLYWNKIDWNSCNDLSECIKKLDDQYTEYLNSGDAVNFMDSLQWNFEGIGAYIKMIDPWIFVIDKVIKWWPAELWWLKSGDIFVQIDDLVVNQDTSIENLVSHIKGKSGSIVKIGVKRWNEILSFDITRWMVFLENISYQKLNGSVCYMKIAEFNQDTLQQFRNGLEFFESNNCDIYMFDLRNNPGGELEVVTNMLNNFVMDGQTIVELRFSTFVQDIIADNSSKKYDKKTIIFVNETSASASEIFAGTLRDYLKDCNIIWSKTFWKWSAQNLVEYVDGSVLKYTIAKRYTWKTKTNIDGKWFEPDIKMSDEKIDLLLRNFGLK